MRKARKIQFDMEELTDISDELIEVNNDCYTKSTSMHQSSLRFPIPTPIKLELDLKASDSCYFVRYSEGYYLSFKVKPDTSKCLMKERKIQSAGKYNTLYLVIPPFIKNLYKKPITNVQLIKTKGFKEYEWQIQFLSSDFT
jgi:hypothetical protein